MRPNLHSLMTKTITKDIPYALECLAMLSFVSVALTITTYKKNWELNIFEASIQQNCSFKNVQFWVSLFSVVENKDDLMYPLPLQHLPNQSLDRGRENGIYRCLPEYSEIICGLLFVIISSSSQPPPRAAGGEDELKDDAVGQAG